MYFCTPTIDPFDGLAKTLQAAYPQTRAVVEGTNRSASRNAIAPTEPQTTRSLFAAA